MKQILNADNITKKYQDENGETIALDKVSLSVEEGEFVSIVGPSGCGKSTLLSIIAGLESPDSGKVEIFGEEIHSPSKNIGYMFQKDNLFEWRTIEENVRLGLEINSSEASDKKKLDKMLSDYGLIDFIYKYPSQLSGGMRQRCSLIRTLATHPKLLLLDEPFSALDYQTRLAVSDDIYNIIKNEGKSAVMVSHDIAECISMSDKVFVMSKRPGRIKKIYEIDGFNSNSTIKRRDESVFSMYFNSIWRDLDVHI